MTYSQYKFILTQRKATAKHGVLGMMRGLVPHLSPNLPIRINAISPSWTCSGLVPAAVVQSTGTGVQGADVVARSAAQLMADESRHGQMIYSVEGRYSEIEESILIKAVDKIIGNHLTEDQVLVKMLQTINASQSNK
jgi:NAD(P)-dependent dehydrogenase (short-subunit alcohol dehydrogenase family)